MNNAIKLTEANGDAVRWFEYQSIIGWLIWKHYEEGSGRIPHEIHFQRNVSAEFVLRSKSSMLCSGLQDTRFFMNTSQPYLVHFSYAWNRVLCAECLPCQVEIYQGTYVKIWFGPLCQFSNICHFRILKVCFKSFNCFRMSLQLKLKETHKQNIQASLYNYEL